MSMQPSLTTMKTQQPASNFSERSNARVARERRRGSKAEAGGGK